MDLTNATISEIAAGSLAAVRVFERFGIDYCCGGKRPLDDVCREKGLSSDAVRSELDRASGPLPTADRDWESTPLTELIAHIVSTHHAYLRTELPRLNAQLDKVARVHGVKHADRLTGLPEVYAELRAELEPHMMKEENVLFPMILHPEACMMQCGVDRPIAVMEMEHEHAGDALARIRKITRDFEPPEGACVTYRALLSGLRELEQDLHLHIHLENNILFPRALRI
jgi:regulator of cell morphogenesis and NO signaling